MEQRSDSDPQRPFLTSVIGPYFVRDQFSTVFEAAQLPGNKLLDLETAPNVPVTLVSDLADQWRVPPGTVSRIALVLAFDVWAVVQSSCKPALEQLAAKGVEVAVFYGQQHHAGHVARWFAGGEPRHEIAAVIAALGSQSRPSPFWPRVIEALANVARSDADAAALPGHLATIAELAVMCDGHDVAESLARECLAHLEATPSSVPRFTALRVLGGSMIARDEISAGVAILEHAVSVALDLGAAQEQALVLSDLGRVALDALDMRRAEVLFRSGIAVITAARDRSPDFVASLHHDLGCALLHLHEFVEAEHHAEAAFDLRTQERSRDAARDLELRARAQQRRVD